MFCLLTVEFRKDCIFEKLFGRMIKDNYELVTVPVLKGAPFFHLTATVGKRGVDFKRVIFETGRCAEKLLIDGDVALPKMKGIGEFNSDLLYKKLLDNSVKFLLDKLGEKAEYDKVQSTIFYEDNSIKLGADRNDFDLSESYMLLKPNSIEKYQFAAALYELCGVFSIGDTRFNTALVNGEKKRLQTINFS